MSTFRRGPLLRRNWAEFSRASCADAAFFRHAHTLSAFQIQLPMPCDEDLWEAITAEEWKRLHDRARQPIQFISALKASLTAVNETTSLNPFSRISVLHGLLSVAQDLQWCVSLLFLSRGLDL